MAIDTLKTLTAPYATFFSGGKFAPRSQAMDQNLQDIIRDQIATTGKGSGIIGYQDFDKSQTPGTEFPDATAMAKNLATGKMSLPEFSNATTLGRLTYDVDPNTGKVNFGSNVYDFRPEVADQGGVFGVFAKMANERNREINPDISIPVDELRGFARDFSQFDQAKMGGTRQPSSFRSMNNPEVYGDIEERKNLLERIVDLGKGLGGGIIDAAKGAGNVLSNLGIVGALRNFDDFKNLSSIDQQFILSQAGGNRPMKDKYGYNIRSARGNYAQLVKDRAKLADFRKSIGKPIRAIDKYYLEKEKERQKQFQQKLQESIQRESGADSYTSQAMAHESKVGRDSGERMGRI